MINPKDYNRAIKILVNRLNVPRGTIEQLERFVELLLKWNKTANLISRKSEQHVWSEHVLDSLQLVEFMSNASLLVSDEALAKEEGAGSDEALYKPNTSLSQCMDCFADARKDEREEVGNEGEKKAPLIMDVGTGAGFPGFVLSLVTGCKVILVEKSSKKCSFLSEAKRQTGANIVVENRTIEETTKYKPDIIISRAVTNVRDFLVMTSKLLHRKVTVMLLKGEECKDEINDAQGKPWSFRAHVRKSKLKGRGAVVVMLTFER